MNDTVDYEVLVVGLGPVGATLACLLGQYGVRTLAIDRAPDVLLMPRAIALDNEALRILQLVGLEEQAFARRAIPRVRFHSPVFGEFARINTCGSVDGHPKLVTFYQPELERALRRRLCGLEYVQTATGVELASFHEDDARVHAELRDADGSTRSVSCRYLVGADGASSAIRAAIGQQFAGRSFAEDWLIVDAERPGSGLEEVEFLCDPRRPTPHMPAPGGRERWEFMLHPGESRERMESEDTIRTLLAPWTPPQGMRIERKAVYRFHARSCERFSRGRVFLAGDAAHVTPPFIGQGLVAGLRDALNLAWKLAWVVRGRAAPDILASYDRERRPHAKRMIDLARLMGHLIMPRSALKAFFVHGLMRLLRLLAPLRRVFEEMHMKPENRFREGLFNAGAGAFGGRWLPQGPVRDAHGALRWSDDVLGAHLVLLGCGAHPAKHLDETAIRRWSAAGGVLAECLPRGMPAAHEGSFEDLGGVLVPGTAPLGWALLVRPDRTILHAGPIAEAGRLVDEALALLGASVLAHLAHHATESIPT